MGNTNLSSSFSGVMQNGSGQLALTKTGTGTITLTGGNTYSGGTALSQGAIQLGNCPGTLTGTLGAGAVTDNAAPVFELASGTTIANAILGQRHADPVGLDGGWNHNPHGGQLVQWGRYCQFR